MSHAARLVTVALAGDHIRGGPHLGDGEAGGLELPDDLFPRVEMQMDAPPDEGRQEHAKRSYRRVLGGADMDIGDVLTCREPAERARESPPDALHDVGGKVAKQTFGDDR